MVEYDKMISKRNEMIETCKTALVELKVFIKLSTSGFEMMNFEFKMDNVLLQAATDPVVVTVRFMLF